MPTKTKAQKIDRALSKLKGTKLLRSNLKKLPPKCYAVDLFSQGDPDLARVILLDRGQIGFRRPVWDNVKSIRGEAACRKFIDGIHQIRGVTRQQESAMLAGSFGGFGIPAADPDNYAPCGRSKRVVEREKKLHDAAPQMLKALRGVRYAKTDQEMYEADKAADALLAEFPE